MVNPDAPIIPYVGMGDIFLKSTVVELRSLLCGAKLVFDDGVQTRYDISDIISLFVMDNNQKLFKLTTQHSYRGKLFEKISTTTNESELLKLEPSLVYDSFEEVYVSEKGVYVETDPVTKLADWISVYVREVDELASELFWNGSW